VVFLIRDGTRNETEIRKREKWRERERERSNRFPMMRHDDGGHNTNEEKNPATFS
jgi:hypothetical protein